MDYFDHGVGLNGRPDCESYRGEVKKLPIVRVKSH